MADFSSNALSLLKMVGRCATLFVVAFVFAMLGIGAAALNQGFSPMWIDSGVFAGILLLAPKRQWLALLLSGGGGIATVLTVFHPNLGRTLSITGCDLLESYLVAEAMRRWAPDVSSLKDLSRMAASGLGATIMVSPVVTPMLNAHHLHWFQAMMFWITSHSLGMVFGIPLTLEALGRRVAGRQDQGGVWIKIGLMGLMMATTLGVFFQNRYPLLFLLFPPVLLYTIIAGRGAGLLAVLVVGLCAILATILQTGPFSLRADLLASEKVVSIQIFLLILGGTVLITSTVLDAQRKADWRLEVANQARAKTEALYRVVAETTSDVILRTKMDGTRLSVSPSVQHVLGWEPERLMQVPWDQVVAAEDFALIDPIAKMRPGERLDGVVFRHKHVDGHMIWVEADVRTHAFQEGEPEWIAALRNVDERERTRHRLVQMAQTDSLTGLSNRARLDEILGRLCQDPGPISVMMIDADAFKLYNDAYGHPAGDQVLKTIASAMLRHVRGHDDLVARYGGEEFCVVLMCDAHIAGSVAERIRQAVLDAQIPHPNSPAGQVSVSIGIVTAHQGPYRPHVLIEQADQALYQAKKLGRNRVVQAQGLYRA